MSTVPKANRKPLSTADIANIVEMLENNTGTLQGKQL